MQSQGCISFFCCQGNNAKQFALYKKKKEYI